MPIRQIVLLIFLLTAPPAYALPHCFYLPICIAATNTPIDDLRFYEDGKLVATWQNIWRPWAKGVQRASRWYCTTHPDGVIEVAAVRAGVELPRSKPVDFGPTQIPAPDCSGGTPAAAAHARDYTTPNQFLAKFSDACFHDASCGQLLWQKCMADTACKASIIQKEPMDLDYDGFVNTNDQAILQWAISGEYWWAE